MEIRNGIIFFDTKAEFEAYVSDTNNVSITNYPVYIGDTKEIITHNVTYKDASEIDASQITSGKISIDRLPAGSLERCVVVANESARFALTTNDVQDGDTVKQSDTGVMYMVVDVNNLNSDAGYLTYTAVTDWESIANKPEFDYVKYSEQELTDEQKQIARENIGVPTKVSELENDKNYLENGSGIIANGIYIYDTLGRFTLPENWDTSQNDLAVGVAVVHDHGAFVVAGDNFISSPELEYNVGPIKWGGFGVDIPDLQNFETPEEAKTDFDGVNNTKKIINALGEDCAAYIATQYIFKNGKAGYLPSAGEMQLYIDCQADVDSVLQTTLNLSFPAFVDEYFGGHVSTELNANECLHTEFGFNGLEGVASKDCNAWFNAGACTYTGSAYEYHLGVYPFLHVEKEDLLIKTNGDGTNLLADDGEYKAIKTVNGESLLGEGNIDVEHLVEVTYQELRMLRNNNKLRVGAKYMITDYDAVTDPGLLNVSYEANTTYNILVTAITSNEIDKIAWLINKSTGKLIKNFIIHYSIDPVATPYYWFAPDLINDVPHQPEKDIISLTANSEILFQTNVEVVIDNTTYYLWDSVSDTKYLSVSKNPVEVNDTLLHIYDADTDTITGTCNWTAHELLRAFGPTYEYSGTNRKYLFVPYNVQIGDTCFELNLSDDNDYTFGIYNDAVEITFIHEQKGCITYMKYLPSNTSCNYDFLHILMKCPKSSYPDVFRHTFTSVDNPVDDSNNYIGNTNIINEGYYNFISNSSDVKIQGDHNVLRSVKSTEIIYSNDNDISGYRLTVYQSDSNSISGYNNILYYATNCSIGTNSRKIVIRQSQSCEITGASINNELIRCSGCSLTTSDDNTLICSNNINLVWGDDNVFDHSSQITVSCKSVDRNIFRNSHNISFDSEGVYANSTDNIFIDSSNIKIGMYCTNNVFNAGCSNIKIGMYCTNNVFNAGCNNITLAKYNCYNTFGNNCDTILFCTTPPYATTESDRAYVQHLTFDNNVKNCVIYDAVGEFMDETEIIQNYYIKNASNAQVNIRTLNQDYILVVNKNSSGEVKIYNEADLIA